MNTATLRHLATRSSWVNEASLTFQRFKWNTLPRNPELIGQEFVGVLRIGGADTEQLFVQDRLSLRNDFSRFTQWKGNHAFKAGVVLSRMQYDVTKFFTANPIFRSDPRRTSPSPSRPSIGVGDPDPERQQHAARAVPPGRLEPDLAADDQRRDPLGLRDATSSTTTTSRRRTWSPRSRASFRRSYFTDGDDRPAFKGAFQPRLGVSYDLSGDGKTVIFGGYGRYYDRVLYNSGLDERFRLQFAVRTFRFSEDGAAPGRPADPGVGPPLPQQGRPRRHHRAAAARGTPRSS